VPDDPEWRFIEVAQGIYSSEPARQPRKKKVEAQTLWEMMAGGKYIPSREKIIRKN
jgi:hypothetical protein